MKKYNFLIASTIFLMASCTSEVGDILPDGSREINVSLSKGVSTRAADGYRDWSATTDPSTMGVIAFTDGTPNPYIYNNTQFSAPTEGDAWEIRTGTKAKWNDYTSATALDFFGYMPYISGATVSKSDNTYTLTLPNVPGVSDTPYLVSTTPVRYASALGNLTPVPFQMDQLMTAFEFQFALGTDMGNLRTFKITRVQMSHIITSASVSQVYTLTAGTWSKGDVTIHPASDHHASAEVTGDIRVGYANGNDETAFVPFPKMLYMLPYDLSTVAPRINVTYEVYDQDGYKTRSTTSEIELNATNFGTIGTVQSAHKNIIKIKIVPTKLHILSDADQSTSGYLIVG